MCYRLVVMKHVFYFTILDDTNFTSSIYNNIIFQSINSAVDLFHGLVVVNCESKITVF